MSLLTSLAESKFAAKCFAVVGIDFAAAFKAGDENAVASAIESEFVTKAEHKTATDSVAKLTADNAKLAADLASLKASASSVGSHLTALESVTGLTVSAHVDDKGTLATDKLATAYKAKVAADARAFLAASGHKPVDEPIVKDPANAKADTPKLTGIALSKAALEASLERLNAKSK